MGCVKNQGRNFTSHRRFAEWGSNNPLKGRRGWGMDPQCLPALLLLYIPKAKVKGEDDDEATHR